MASEKRRQLNAKVTGDAYHSWHRLAAELGCSYTALIEALGLFLDEHDGITDVRRSTWHQLAVRARQIDAERRLRPRDEE